MGHYDYNVEELGDFTPFENFQSGIRDDATRTKYRGQLEMFLNPRYRWDLPQQKRALLPDDKLAVLVNGFVELMGKDPARGKEKIKRYVQYVRKQTAEGSLNSNTARNRLRPIKSLLRSN